MARKIRFPLIMKNGAEVRSLEELQENFDLESVIGYFTDGKLQTWLADHFYDDKAEAVSQLSADMSDLNEKLCEILEIGYSSADDETDIEVIQRRNEKLTVLRQAISDDALLEQVDIIALDQDDLYDILDTNPETVYLYGEKFSIPTQKKNVKYIGINNPLVLLGKMKTSGCAENGISFEDVRFEDGADDTKANIMVEQVEPKKMTKALEPVGKFDIDEDGVLLHGEPDEYGVCVIPDSVTEIGDEAFEGCDSLTSVVIPDSVTEIGESAFESCDSLTSVVIPNSVTKIGDRAFGWCESLTSIVLPDSVTEIGESAFEYCKSLTSVVLPDSVTEIGESAFESCESLTSVVIPNSVTKIGDRAFGWCESLTSVVIPNSVTEIGDRAFESCESLTSVVIPNSVTEIGESAFDGCESLTSVVIPDSVTEIGNYAFNGCDSLTSVVIPDSVTEIGDSAFEVWDERGISQRPNCVILCSKGSYAEEYADEYGIDCEYI